MTTEPLNTDADEGRLRPAHRPSTIVWGVLTLTFAAFLMAIARGAHFSIFTLIIITLGSLGLAALLLALIPRPRARVENTPDTPRLDLEALEILEPTSDVEATIPLDPHPYSAEALTSDEVSPKQD